METAWDWEIDQSVTFWRAPRRNVALGAGMAALQSRNREWSLILSTECVDTLYRWRIPAALLPMTRGVSISPHFSLGFSRKTWRKGVS